MLNRIKKLFEFSSKNGLYLPAAFNAETGKPSVTLLFTHIANTVAIIAIGILTYKDINLGTIAAICYSIVTMLLYLMRRVTKFKFDADDREIEVVGEETQQIETQIKKENIDVPQ